MPEVQFGPYTLVRRIAVGGMAEVYLARRGEGADRRALVVKQILPQLAEEPELLQLFFDEARIASRVVHPGIVRVVDVGAHDGVHFLAMEYVDGLDLSQLMRLVRELGPDQQFPLGAALRIVIDLARALDFVHDAKDVDGSALEIVHRDVSPQNVLVSRAGDVKLGDFGIARAKIRARRTATGILRGKIAYVSPEQYLGQRGDRRVDVYALGVVLFELLSGRRPFAGDEASVIREVMSSDAPNLATFVPGIDVRIASIVALALARKPEQRVPTAGALADALERLNIAKGRELVADLVVRSIALRDRARGAPAVVPSLDGASPAGP
ncbi:serine/threonine protein kinase, partial [Myxococcota bacterium]|nr:serine/threonine protein kinase [Myxococcota bacterium]